MRFSIALSCALALGACGDDSSSDGGRSDAPLPDSDGGLRNGCNSLRTPVASPGDPIDGDTYATFATDFFPVYCTRCHSTTLVTPEERNGAPPGRNWDDEASVRMFLPDMRLWVVVANAMPLIIEAGQPRPSCEERFRLVRWIDAGAP